MPIAPLAGSLAALAVVALAAGPLRAEPRVLGDGQLDRVTGAGLREHYLASRGVPSPEAVLGTAGSVQAKGFSSQLVLPTATAVAICWRCSGNASAVAVATAVGQIFGPGSQVVEADALSRSIVDAGGRARFPVVILPLSGATGAAGGGSP